METIKDEQLIEIYKKAIEFDLNKDFVQLLSKEISLRGLNTDTN